MRDLNTDTGGDSFFLVICLCYFSITDSQRNIMSNKLRKNNKGLERVCMIEWFEDENQVQLAFFNFLETLTVFSIEPF